VPDPTAKLGKLAMVTWGRMWDRPVAVLWDEADVAALTRLVRLQHSTVADARVLAEIRQLEDRFLLNPYARAQQRVVIQGDGSEDEEAADVSWIEDARRRLRDSG
jgi:hypothetical protein